MAGLKVMAETLMSDFGQQPIFILAYEMGSPRTVKI